MARWLLVVLLLLVVWPAHAFGQFPSTRDGGTEAPSAGGVAAVVDALRERPVYVDPAAEHALSDAEQRRLIERISSADAGPVFVAVVPDALRQEAGGSTNTLAQRIATGVGERGVYAVLAGEQLRAGSLGGALERGVAGDLARTALERRADAGAGPTLVEFVDLVGRARAEGGVDPVDHHDPGGGGAAGLAFLAVLGGSAGLLFWRGQRRRRREREAQVAELKENATEDLVALGDDVRALDLDVEMPGADPQAKHHYAEALGHYERAERALDHAADPQDFGPIAEELEQGRYAMTAAKALLAGEPVPERRPPCFFDPRHGPSTRDVLWSPDGYDPRPVPACEADAVRVEQGDEPLTRELLAGGRRVPLYAAPAYFGPYAGGFFGGFGGFVPGLLFGSMLGGGLGGLGGFGGFGGTAYGDTGGGGFDDFGGGDLSDFGGGGDLGGGDFGGGDF